jgi:hypothetical protein
VYHDRLVTPPPDATTSQVSVGSPSLGTPAGIIGSYLRPFIYGGKSYLLTYDMEPDATTQQTKQGRKRKSSPREHLYILSLTYKEPKGDSEKPSIVESNVCTYSMVRLDNEQ